MNAPDHTALGEKLTHLISLLADAGSAVLAFSGGVDSSFLLKAMKMAGIRFLAVTGCSETVPEKDIEQAVAFAQQQGAELRLIRTGEMQNALFVANPPDRCFHCKQDLFRRLREIAEREDYRFIFDGSNADDLNDYRPGRKAAMQYDVRSPLAEIGFSKQDIRLLSKDLGLSAWDRPASPCLSSRFPYGQRITPDLLRRVEKAETFLRSLGVSTVRVRVHDDLARIEVPEQDLHFFLGGDVRHRVASALHALGFNFISLDLEGFRSGSMNRSLTHQARQNMESL